MMPIPATPFGCRRCNQAFSSRIHNLDAHILAHRRNEPGAAAAAGVNAQARADGTAADRAAKDRAAEDRAAADRDNLNAAVNSLITIQRAFENVAKVVDQGRKDVAKAVQVIHTHGNALAGTVARLSDTAGKISLCTSFTASTFNVLVSKS